MAYTKLQWAACAAVLTGGLFTGGMWAVGQAPSAPAPAEAPKPKELSEKPAPAKQEFPRATLTQRTKSANNLKQLMLAIHNYHDTNGVFPHDVTDNAGKPLLSWRVQILPYLEQDNLYRAFKLDEPWDSDNNKKLIAKMPKTFEMAGIETKEKGQTFFQTFVGKKGDAIRPLMLEGEQKGLGIVGISDGSSNTFMVVEAAEPVIWTKPGDLPFDANEKLPKLGRRQRNGFNVVFCDGSVRFIKSTTPEATLKAYITTNGGEVIDD